MTWKNLKKPKTIIAIAALVLLLIFIAPNYTYALGEALVSGVVGAGGFLGEKVLVGFAKFLSSTYLSIASYILSLAGLALNFAIKLSMNIKGIVAALPGIAVAWTVLRDVVTMFFIFILLYTSFNVIIGKASMKETGNLIRDIIIAGFLINFSMVIVKLIIDACNVLAIGIYNAIIPVEAGNSISNGIGSVVMNAINGGMMYTQSQDPGAIAEASNYILMTIFMGSLMLTTAIIFLVGAGLFIFRTIKLIGIIAASPFIAFNFIGIPLLADFNTNGKKLWGQLISSATFAPIFLLIMYIGLKIMVGSSGSLVNYITDSAGAKGTSPWMFGINKAPLALIASLINYSIVMAFFVAALKVAKDAGIEGSEKIMGWADNMQKKVSSENFARTMKNSTGWVAGKAGRVAGVASQGTALAIDKSLGNKWSESKNYGAKTAYTLLNKGTRVATSNVVNDVLKKAKANTGFLANPIRQMAGSAQAKFDATSTAQYAKKENTVDKEIEKDRDLKKALKKINESKDGFFATNNIADQDKLVKEIRDSLDKLPEADRQKAFSIKDIIKTDTPENTAKSNRLVAMLGDSYVNSFKKKEGAKEEDIIKLKEARDAGILDELAPVTKQNTPPRLSQASKSAIEHFRKLPPEELIAMLSKNDPVNNKPYYLAPKLLKHLTSQQLGKLREEITDIGEAKKIAEIILDEHYYKNNSMSSKDQITKNPGTWGLTDAYVEENNIVANVAANNASVELLKNII